MTEQQDKIPQVHDRLWLYAVDFAWIVIDSQDEVALFYCDAASCPLAAQLLYTESEYDRIIRTILDELEDQGPEGNEANTDWALNNARKGFHVYQFSIQENAFKRIGVPGTPIKLSKASHLLASSNHLRITGHFSSDSSSSLTAQDFRDHTGGELTLPVAEVPSWEEFSPFLEESSSLRDIYAYSISMDDWKAIQEVFRRVGDVSHRIGDRSADDILEIIQPDEKEGIGITAMEKAGLLINCHHFDPEKFEADLSPREINDSNYKTVFELMIKLSSTIKRPIYLCEESRPEAIIYSTYAGLNVRSLDEYRKQNPGRVSFLEKIKSILR